MWLLFYASSAVSSGTHDMSSVKSPISSSSSASAFCSNRLQPASPGQCFFFFFFLAFSWDHFLFFVYFTNNRDTTWWTECPLGFPGGTSGEEPACQCRRHETQIQSQGWGDPLEEGMATHTNIIAWKVPGTEDTGGLQSIGSQRGRHDWSDLAQHNMDTSFLLSLP